jgi:hypothetical protein
MTARVLITLPQAAAALKKSSLGNPVEKAAKPKSPILKLVAQVY